MSGSDDGALFRLSPAARSRILTIENSIKSEYMEMIQNLSLTELKSFNKHTYKEMMIIIENRITQNHIYEKIETTHG
jgi:hypothetical protein